MTATDWVCVPSARLSAITKLTRTVILSASALGDVFLSTSPQLTLVPPYFGRIEKPLFSTTIFGGVREPTISIHREARLALQDTVTTAFPAAVVSATCHFHVTCPPIS